MMIKRFILLALGLCGSLSLMAQGDYDTYFTDKSLRVDFILRQ